MFLVNGCIILGIRYEKKNNILLLLRFLSNFLVNYFLLYTFIRINRHFTYEYKENYEWDRIRTLFHLIIHKHNYRSVICDLEKSIFSKIDFIIIYIQTM